MPGVRVRQYRLGRLMLRPTPDKSDGAARPVEEADLAARSLVCALFDAASGSPGFWTALTSLNEKIQTVVRAVICGWIVVYNHRREDGSTVLAVALTDEGRRL